MKKRFNFFLALFFMPGWIFAMEIQVKEDVLRDMERFGFGQGAPFTESFKCGQNHNFLSNITFCELKCKDKYCEENCAYPKSKEEGKFTLTPEDCTSDEVSVFGSNGFKAKISRTEYEKWNNNWFMVFLSNIGKFIQPISIVKVDYAVPIHLYRIVDGQKQVVPRAFQIGGSMQIGEAKNTTMFHLYVTNNFNGPEQILLFGMDVYNQVFLKLDGIKHGVPQ